MAKNRGTEEHRLWLFGLAHGSLKDQEIIRGFIEYYILNNLRLATIESDFARYTLCPAECIREGVERLRRGLEQAATDGLSTNKNASAGGIRTGAGELELFEKPAS